jgi:hypothetical protein
MQELKNYLFSVEVLGELNIRYVTMDDQTVHTITPLNLSEHAFSHQTGKTTVTPLVKYDAEKKFEELSKSKTLENGTPLREIQLVSGGVPVGANTGMDMVQVIDSRVF